jgi:LmbE family N-acetylglucosaminyl deacetylase
MDWKRERDALIAQTHAFVQSVTAKMAEAPQSAPPGSETRLPAVTPHQPPVEPEPAATRLEATPDEPLRALEPPAAAGPPPLTDLHSDEQDEIRARIASFRAHQERFNRERAEYFNATLGRVRAALEEAPPAHAGPNHPGARPLSRIPSPIPATNVSETLMGSRSSENGRGPS